MPEMNRVVVVGSSGSGKSTLAREIHRLENFPLLDLPEPARRHLSRQSASGGRAACDRN